MLKRNHLAIGFVFLLMFTFGYSSPEKGEAEVLGNSDYDSLVGLFKEFLELQKPKVNNGVPDYTPAAMKKQSSGLKKFQSRLAAIDPIGWPVSMAWCSCRREWTKAVRCWPTARCGVGTTSATWRVV